MGARSMPTFREYRPSSQSEENKQEHPAALYNARRDAGKVRTIKRYGNLFEKVIDYDNLYAAYEKAAKGKRFKPDVMRTTARLECILTDIQNELASGTWKPQNYYEFELRTEVKRRIVDAPTFRDCIVHHAILNVVEPLFEKKMIHDSYANRIGKGTHKAVLRVKEFLRRKPERVYILQGDVSKYFPSIDHAILKKVISRTIADERLLALWYAIIDGFNSDTGKGIPIGSPISQLEAGIYLMELDHFVKESLHVSCYVRLMDDFILIDEDKAVLEDCHREILWYLQTQRKLSLNPKTHIYPTKQGIDFGGYRIWRGYALARKRNVKAAKIRFKAMSWLYRYGYLTLEDVRSRVASFLGYMKFCQGKRTTVSTLKHLVLQRRFSWSQWFFNCS